MSGAETIVLEGRRVEFHKVVQSRGATDNNQVLMAGGDDRYSGKKG